MVLGNAVCLVGYAVVLRRFFRRRIESMFALPVRRGFVGKRVDVFADKVNSCRRGIAACRLLWYGLCTI